MDPRGERIDVECHISDFEACVRVVKPICVLFEVDWFVIKAKHLDVEAVRLEVEAGRDPAEVVLLMPVHEIWVRHRPKKVHDVAGV